ncbi:DUF6262 family protein [Pseudonocardia nigra]|uniref:DUF6262 family protein n=1 Tax=Pseudonocardia nigra TaxID=1921578 RepID=UPI001C5CC80E|nr:DUF6262 family protein [Pseudonocardia nigra]
MRPDPTAGMITAARRRSELTRAKAIRALRELDGSGAPISFEAVAHAAGVSRSWLYAQADLRAEIERLRQATRRAPAPPVPAIQRASDASLLARLQVMTERNRQLAEENQRLRRQQAHALGDQRTTTRSTQQPPPAAPPTVAVQ